MKRIAVLLLLSACSLKTTGLPTTPAAGAPYPGGPLAPGKGNCGAAHNHCLRDAAWFAKDGRPVFERDGRWWTWQETPEPREGPAHRTVVASDGNVAAGATIVWYSDRYTKAPDSELGAHFTGQWAIGLAKAFDGAIIQVGNQAVELERARVVVETR